MSRIVFYAMDKVHLQAYIDHKNDISAALAAGRYDAGYIEKLKAEIDEYHNEDRELYTVDGDGTAHIAVCGPLEPKPDPCAILFDQDMTTYSDIINATQKAESDPNVRQLQYHFETPGGNVVGLFRAADVLAACKKKKTAMIGSLCASAGYALASQMGIGNVFAENISAEVGSIGILMEVVDDSGADNGMGIKRYILTSDNAPDKAPDVSKPSGRQKLVDRLNEMEAVFYDYVAKGRNTNADNIKNNYGRGGVLIAKKALQAGMIDGIITDITNSKPAQPQNATVVIPGDMGGQNATDTAEIITKESNSMEITQEALDKLASDTAKKTAESVRAEMSAKFEEQQNKFAAEEKRKAGFTALYDRFPNQKAMIDEAKEKGESATAEFVLKLADTEKARVAAAADQKNGSETAAGNIKPEKADEKALDISGADFAAMFGIKTEAK
jgi:ClpP class serine protease